MYSVAGGHLDVRHGLDEVGLDGASHGAFDLIERIVLKCESAVREHEMQTKSFPRARALCDDCVHSVTIASIL